MFFLNIISYQRTHLELSNIHLSMDLEIIKKICEHPFVFVRFSTETD